ncbi:hypothetical protein [Halorarum salinum]
MCCHDADTGALTAVIDTGAPEAREWAVPVFERYRREASPVESDALDALVSSEPAT